MRERRYKYFAPTHYNHRNRIGMKLNYCYIENFRNIHNQEVLLSDKFKCQYKAGEM